MGFNKAKYCGLALFLSTLGSTVTFADGQPVSNNYFSLKNTHLIFELGGFYATQGTDEGLYVKTLVGNTYTVTSHNQGSGVAGVGLFLDAPEWNLFKFSWDRFKISYGANVFFLGSTSTKGYVVQENHDTNLTYTYKIQNIPLFFMAKSIIDTNSEKYKVALDVGIGPNFIHTSDYNEVALTSWTHPDNSFSANNSTTFAATAGIGLRFNNIADKIPLECGYRFFYLGQGQLAMDNGQLINTVKTGHNYANALICSIVV